jgi:two-component system response regulator PilR (NtrC family)
MSKRIIIVEDEETLRNTLASVLEEEGYEVSKKNDAASAVEAIREENFDLVITDLKMPGMDGINLLQKVMKMSPQTFVILMTAYGTVETAVEAMQKGAYDYIMKPFLFDDVLNKLKRLFQYKRVALENQVLRQELEERFDFFNIIGESPLIQKVIDLVRKVAPTRSNILIAGESGTGKELIARAIHYSSPRKDMGFIPITCSAIPESLLESELFGHKKGAFTGADREKKGLFEVAQSGTLLLDEIGEMPLTLQAKLLRVIEEKEILPLGGTKTVPVDVRIIAATNKDLVKEVENGKFREDLFYRLNVVTIQLPPLRERTEDIPLLVRHFLQKLNKELKKSFRGVSNDGMRALLNAQWKGNVRELENVLERAIILGEGEFITLKDLPEGSVGRDSTSPGGFPTGHLREVVKDTERRYILRLLREASGDKQTAAENLGMSLSSLYRKIEELAIH